MFDPNDLFEGANIPAPPLWLMLLISAAVMGLALLIVEIL